MATESQLLRNAYYDQIHIPSLYGGQVGQRLTISNRTVQSLSFFLKRTGSQAPSDYGYWFEIRKVSDDSLVASKEMTPTMNISTLGEWKTGTFASPVLINEEVRIYVRNTAAIGGSNYISIAYQSTDVKASESLTRYPSSVWTEDATYDLAYQYEWGVAPAVTTQAATAVAKITATGNGNVTNLGSPAATQHGHCWSTSANPTIADSKTENGVPAATGPFTSAITGLTPNTLYHTRAYVTNSDGTSYGADVEFTTLKAGGAGLNTGLAELMLD